MKSDYSHYINQEIEAQIILALKQRARCHWFLFLAFGVGILIGVILVAYTSLLPALAVPLPVWGLLIFGGVIDWLFVKSENLHCPLCNAKWKAVEGIEYWVACPDCNVPIVHQEDDTSMAMDFEELDPPDDIHAQEDQPPGLLHRMVVGFAFLLIFLMSALLSLVAHFGLNFYSGRQWWLFLLGAEIFNLLAIWGLLTVLVQIFGPTSRLSRLRDKYTGNVLIFIILPLMAIPPLCAVLMAIIRIFEVLK